MGLWFYRDLRADTIYSYNSIKHYSQYSVVNKDYRNLPAHFSSSTLLVPFHETQACSELSEEGLSCSVWRPNCIQSYPPVCAPFHHFTWLHFFIQIIHQAFKRLGLFLPCSFSFWYLWCALVGFQQKKKNVVLFSSRGALLLKHLKSQVRGGACRTDRHAWPI